MPTRARWTRPPRLAPDGSALGEDDAPLGPSASLGEAEAFADESAANPHMELVLANPDLAGTSPSSSRSPRTPTNASTPRRSATRSRCSRRRPPTRRARSSGRSRPATPTRRTR